MAASTKLPKMSPYGAAILNLALARNCKHISHSQKNLLHLHRQFTTYQRLETRFYATLWSKPINSALSRNSFVNLVGLTRK